ncbi:MAG: glycoside hydrolase family 57 protein [Bacteroidales bacterium]|nr:glycoside hydrolase family 57 protein [Bacteroidales bacterium]MDD3299303.1 glycoside hydrolase family 57 protein [Bacteroidales bacterium]MDD3843775.1 glycoside hydrolase family 57 protein [Bacteroidales bacterium]MDD4617535.1 glycoside hydrolase family 57 protein [Bacteroidales bacterium]
MERSICFYFQVHQPHRLRLYRFFDIGREDYYYDDFANKTILKRVAEKCYLPANELMLELIKRYKGSFKVTYSISGTVLEQFKEYAPEVIESFRELAKTGSVEFLAETYAHSLSSLTSAKEFKEQVLMHSNAIESLFGVKPKVFRNTELIYSDVVGAAVAEMGYTAMLTEGAKHILGWKSPNYLYTNAINPRLKLMLKNFRLSDDIAFRFSDRSWENWPLTSDKYAAWLANILSKEEIVNLFMDYETFGEHQGASTGIFEFMRNLPGMILSRGDIKFDTPSGICDRHQPVAPLHVPFPISWADEERDTSAWLGNELQNEAFAKLYALEDDVKNTNDPKLLSDFRRLQQSDHFYYMCTKFFSDGAVHKYFNPYDTPYEAFINYMNVLSDFNLRIQGGTILAEDNSSANKRSTKRVRK